MINNNLIPALILNLEVLLPSQLVINYFMFRLGFNVISLTYSIQQAKGFDTRQHTLACFGGAGAQHACAVARALGMTRVFIHKYAGILSAFGMACADVVQESQVPAATEYIQGY